MDWKDCRLETLKVDWKQNKYIGNMNIRLETKNVDWKHKNKIGNGKCRLET